MARNFNSNNVSDMNQARGNGRGEPTAGFVNLIITDKNTGDEIEITGAALVASGNSVKQKRQAVVYEALKNDPDYLQKMMDAGRVRLKFHDYAASQEQEVGSELAL